MGERSLRIRVLGQNGAKSRQPRRTCGNLQQTPPRGAVVPRCHDDGKVLRRKATFGRRAGKATIKHRRRHPNLRRTKKVQPAFARGTRKLRKASKLRKKT